MNNVPAMVLLIDDQPMVGELVRRMLAPEVDLELHYCSDPNDAIQLALAIKPSVILQDLVMPGVDGLDMVRAFRASSDTSHIPIIVLSSKEDPAVKSEAFAAGANDYLVKLPDRVELLARLRYHSDAYLTHLQRDDAMRALRSSQHQLLGANTALAETNQKLNQFVGMAAHDLRNPLTVMIGFAKFLMMDPQAVNFSDRQARFIASMGSNAEFMLRLVNNLLDVSKIEAGEISLERQPTDLVQLIEQNVAVNRILTEDKNITFEFSAPREVPPAYVDPDKIEQVLNNLLSNAAKFSAPHTTVVVTIAPLGRTIEVCVTDQGPGIPADELDKLFKPFSRTSVKPTSGEKSTGLGLLIAKQVVDAHGGTIRVESVVGTGTSFVVTLPV
ncbi:MAG: hybrid sensor histidine kinase/response regulator [Longimicrobiales bacterium]